MCVKFLSQQRNEIMFTEISLYLVAATFIVLIRLCGKKAHAIAIKQVHPILFKILCVVLLNSKLGHTVISIQYLLPRF